MEAYNDCYLIGFVGDKPTESAHMDVWKGTFPLCFLSPDNRLSSIPVVLKDKGKKADFMKRQLYETLVLHGHLQKNEQGESYLYLLDFFPVSNHKCKRSAILSLVDHIGSRVFLQGMQGKDGLFVPRVGQKKNVTKGDWFPVNEICSGRYSLTVDNELIRASDHIEEDETELNGEFL